jgi:Zn-finger nucleic acid-binding protein
MKCPKCGSDLEEVNYENVMIDRCTDCQGIWLDYGELDILAEGQATLSKKFLRKLFK